jgi:pyrroline-5-carboxylate reductase
MTLSLAGPLLLVGAGKMGGALLEGWLRQGLDPTHVFVRDPAPPAEVAALIARHGIETARFPAKPSTIVIAVKPQLVGETLAALTSHIDNGTVILSIAAGRTLASLAEPVPKGTAIVRAMPNTAAAIGHSMTVACANDLVSRAQALECSLLLEAVGQVMWVEDENLMDAITAVSGSGPAYVFLLAECLAEAGREAGLDAELANALARATVSGAGALLGHSDLSAAKLRENVTSPKGTTAAALEVLTGKGGFKELLTRAVAAAAKRSRELSS